jgi:hypothetical protein
MRATSALSRRLGQNRWTDEHQGVLASARLPLPHSPIAALVADGDRQEFARKGAANHCQGIGLVFPRRSGVRS